MLHLGLEDDADGVQVEGTRQMLLGRPLAPARDQQGGNGGMGREDKLLGLSRAAECYKFQMRIQYFQPHKNSVLHFKNFNV